MESTPDNFAKKFMANIERHRRITEFENSITASFNIVMGIKIRKQRLESLFELLEDSEKKIREIEALSTIYKPEGLNECLGLGDSLSAEAIKWQKDMADIKRLRDFKISIALEISKLKLLLSLRKETDKKSIEEQYISLYRNTTNVKGVDLLLKSAGYIDKDGHWLGERGFIGELKVLYDILKEKVLVEGKVTTQARVFYKRFQYAGKYNERTLRNNINNPEIINSFKKLLTPILRKYQ